MLCDEQGFVADTCTKIQTAFHEDAKVLLSISASPSKVTYLGGLRLPQPTLMLGRWLCCIGNAFLAAFCSHLRSFGSWESEAAMSLSCRHTVRLVALRPNLSMSTEDGLNDSFEYARTLALPQALSLDLSPVALTLV